MRLVLQAFIGSIVIHVVYFVGMMLVGYIKTRNYKPEIINQILQAHGIM
ncbi:hypothetical protein JSQ81_05825 [Sporosarcina sp. Marseille-Q4063]|nr:hypothetical protein [Sporosarcina sp. Marseille-Q4063]QUW23085.1 hypothetical protein JSQ81_05825 [Sporosarcina sp. Marseille-Q4063]